jgi:hypothetical protein
MVTVVSPEHWTSGLLPLGGNRLQDVLNDPLSGFLELSDVAVRQRPDGEPVARPPHVVLPKSGIEFVIDDELECETPEKRWNHYRSKESFEAFAVVGGKTIRGNLHLLRPTLDPRNTLANELHSFFPLTDAWISHGQFDSRRFPLVFVHKTSVSAFHVSGVTNKPTTDRVARSAADAEDDVLGGVIDNLGGLLAASQHQEATRAAAAPAPTGAAQRERAQDQG